eukprot:TRINITY_DN10199_c0_g1_i2.p1 TRINITY_DN10199_c0_g1~~TRINITY_DN10199_c0_g1_i2.p1  ORF type:complete len:384 (-),score=89.57 TRINITY_DN10199_c0_g1_i2:1164-2315(-)
MQSKVDAWSYVNKQAYDFPEGLHFTPVEYIWIGGTGQDIRAKTKVYPRVVTKLEELEEWNYDGSSTYQATTENSEIRLRPVKVVKDPFRRPYGLLALCETYHGDGTPAVANFRFVANKVMEKAKSQHPWFGFEQEYCIYVTRGTNYKYPLGWPEGGFPTQQGPYYCSQGASYAYGRELVELHQRSCAYAGITYAGRNAETMPSQWEYQNGPCEGINSGDEMFLSRYLLRRCGEVFGLDVSFDPKPVKGWAGTGGHCNFSTEKMRAAGGIAEIQAAITKLGEHHNEHILLYGEGNEQRLTGKNETSPIDIFSYGIGSRAASIRIPNGCNEDQKGYLEDRRPAGNCDPYLVTALLVSTVCLNGEFNQELIDAYKSSKARSLAPHH